MATEGDRGVPGRLGIEWSNGVVVRVIKGGVRVRAEGWGGWSGFLFPISRPSVPGLAMPHSTLVPTTSPAQPVAEPVTLWECRGLERSVGRFGGGVERGIRD